MVLVVLALVIHYLFILGGAPIEIRWRLLNIFVSTLAAAILTFLGGIYDCFFLGDQLPRRGKKRGLFTLWVKVNADNWSTFLFAKHDNRGSFSRPYGKSYRFIDEITVIPNFLLHIVWKRIYC
jgi:hypothetical protein